MTFHVKFPGRAADLLNSYVLCLARKREIPRKSEIFFLSPTNLMQFAVFFHMYSCS